jgi:fatty acid desaturase
MLNEGMPGQTTGVESRRPSLLGVLVWWIGIALVGGLIAWALIDVAYSRVIYLFIVMPVAGVLLFQSRGRRIDG